MCETFHCLPRAGGLLDQDSYMVYLLQAVSTVHAEKQNRETQRMEEQADAARHA